MRSAYSAASILRRAIQMSFKFAVGQTVEYKSVSGQPSLCTIVKRMPEEHGQHSFRYRIKIEQEKFERNVFEYDLTASGKPANLYSFVERLHRAKYHWMSIASAEILVPKNGDGGISAIRRRKYRQCDSRRIRSQWSQIWSPRDKVHSQSALAATEFQRNDGGKKWKLKTSLRCCKKKTQRR